MNDIDKVDKFINDLPKNQFQTLKMLFFSTFFTFVEEPEKIISLYTIEIVQKNESQIMSIPPIIFIT